MAVSDPVRHAAPQGFSFLICGTGVIIVRPALLLVRLNEMSVLKAESSPGQAAQLVRALPR